MESQAATPVLSLPELAQLGGPRARIARPSEGGPGGAWMGEMTFVGIDVSKARLDVALPGGEAFRVANNAGGIEELVSRLDGLILGVIVLEATGGYEMEAWTALSDAGLPVA